MTELLLGVKPTSNRDMLLLEINRRLSDTVGGIWVRLPLLEELPPATFMVTIAVVDALEDIEGFVALRVAMHHLHIEKAPLYEWADLLPQICQALEAVFDEPAVIVNQDDIPPRVHSDSPAQ